MKSILTNTQGVAAVSVLLVILSLIGARLLGEPDLFGASGALMVIAGVILAARRLIRLGYEGDVRDKQTIDGGTFRSTDGEKKADREFREDERAYQWSLWLLVAGTFIWAYGSLSLKWAGLGTC